MSDRIPASVVKKVRERAQSVCERCRKPGRTELHHRQFRGRGGAHTPSNLVAVCGFGNTDGCHGFAHTRETEARAAGWSISSGRRDTGAIPFRDVAGFWWLLDDIGEKVCIPQGLADEYRKQAGIYPELAS